MGRAINANTENKKNKELLTGRLMDSRFESHLVSTHSSKSPSHNTMRQRFSQPSHSTFEVRGGGFAEILPKLDGGCENRILCRLKRKTIPTHIISVLGSIAIKTRQYMFSSPRD